MILRALLVLEFLAALGAWSVDACVWPLAGLVMAGSLTTFLLTWDDRAPWDVIDNVCDRGAYDEAQLCAAPESAP